MMTSRLMAAVAVAACIHLLSPKRPTTCIQAGRMGAAVRKRQDRAPYRAKARELYRRHGKAIPDALIEEVKP